MNRALGILLSIVLVFALSSTSFVIAQVQDGEWETTVKMKMEGMGFSIPAVTTKQCITKDNMVPNMSQSNGKDTCTVKDQKIAGNKVTWAGSCTDKDQKSEFEGEITYSGSSYQGTMKMKSTDKSGQTMAMTGTMSGRRIGECKDKNTQTIKVGNNEYKVNQAEARKMADQAQAQMAQLEKNKAEQKARWDAFNKAPVPEEAPGSCALNGKSFAESDCKGKITNFKFKPGEWEITIQKGSLQTLDGKMQGANVEEPQKSTQCVTYDSPILSNLEGTWDYKVSPRGISGATRDSVARESGKGGYVFNEDTLEGAFITNLDFGVSKSVTRINITGRRIGDSNCQGRDYTAQGRDYTSKKRKTPADAAPNPAKKVRKLLGF